MNQRDTDSNQQWDNLNKKTKVIRLKNGSCYILGGLRPWPFDRVQSCCMTQISKNLAWYFLNNCSKYKAVKEAKTIPFLCLFDVIWVSMDIQSRSLHRQDPHPGVLIHPLRLVLTDISSIISITSMANSISVRPLHGWLFFVGLSSYI